MVGDAGEFAQGDVEVFGANADAGVTVGGEGVRAQRDGELFFVGCADDAVAADAVAMNMIDPMDQWSLPLPWL